MVDLQQGLQRLFHPPTTLYPHTTVSVLSLYSLTLSLVFLVSLVERSVVLPIQAVEAPAPIPYHSPIILTAVQTPTPTESPDPLIVPTADIPTLIQERPAIIQYITTIFGANAKTAIAVATAESGKVDPKTGQRYFATSAVHRSDIETSIGLFQVNLKSKETLVHYHRIPGSTLEEKIVWLQNPYNNTLFAYWIYSTSGFHPWSAFSKGNYLAYLR